MIINVRLIKFGSTLALALPKTFVAANKLKKGDTAQFNLVFLSKITDDYKCYKCVLCGHRFDIDEDEPYCPACGSEDVIIVEEDSILDEIMEREEIENKKIEKYEGEQNA